MRPAIILLMSGVFLMGFSSSAEFQRLKRAKIDWSVQRHLPDVTDLQELLSREGDLICPDEYTESGEKMILTSAGVFRPEVLNVGNGGKDLNFPDDGYSYGYLRNVAGYTHANIQVSTIELTPTMLSVNPWPLNADDAAYPSIRCTYYDQYNNKKIRGFVVDANHSRCFFIDKVLMEGDHYVEFDGTSNFFWCR